MAEVEDMDIRWLTDSVRDQQLTWQEVYVALKRSQKLVKYGLPVERAASLLQKILLRLPKGHRRQHSATFDFCLRLLLSAETVVNLTDASVSLMETALLEAKMKYFAVPVVKACLQCNGRLSTCPESGAQTYFYELNCFGSPGIAWSNVRVVFIV